MFKTSNLDPSEIQRKKKKKILENVELDYKFGT